MITIEVVVEDFLLRLECELNLNKTMSPTKAWGSDHRVIDA